MDIGANVGDSAAAIRAESKRPDPPAFAKPALIKLDTDRMDVAILLANPLVERLRPVLFFEYDPHLGAEPAVFERLHERGYATADYENTGEHMARVELPAHLHERCVGHGSVQYADVCVSPQ